MSKNKYFLGLLLFATSGISLAAFNKGEIDLSNAQFTVVSGKVVRLTNVNQKNELYDLDLQWDVNSSSFKILSSKARSQKSLTCITTDYSEMFSRVNFVVNVEPDSRAVSVQIVGKAEASFGSPNFDLERFAILQNGKLLRLAWGRNSLNENTALAIPEAGWILSRNGHNGTLSEGVTQTLTLDRIPVWFDVSKPISGVVYSGKNNRCM